MKTKFFALSIVLISLASCKKEGCTDPKATNYNEKAKKDNGNCIYTPTPVTIEFEHTVDGSSLQFDQMIYTSAAGNKYSVQTLKYFISDITVEGSGETQDVFIDKEFYVDAEDASTLIKESVASLPAGEYSGVSFRWGLSKEKNTSGRFPNPPESNMEWPAMMGGGYHFMKLEGQYDSLATGNIKYYNTHIGNPSSDYDNSFIVSFSELFTVKGDEEIHITINMEINNWYQNPHTYDFNNYDSGIMGNQTVQQMLKENGQTDVFSIKEIHAH
jgi:hypothetical protein